MASEKENGGKKVETHKPESVETSMPRQEVIIKTESSKSNGCLYAFLIAIAISLIIFLCSVGSFALIGLSAEDEVVQEGSEDVIALITIEGIISSSQQQSFFGGVTGPNDTALLHQLNRAAEDEKVKAILINIESPGGEAVASDIVAKKVLEVREIKPVVAYSATMAASGGYMIASAANEFVVHPGDLTGSIGVIMQTSSMEGLYEKLGIENITIKSDRFKDNQELFEDPDGELYSIYQGIIDEAYDQFVEIIVTGRGMDEALVRELGDGRLYSGRQAVANGLADSEGYFPDAIESAEELAGIDNSTVVDYSTDTNWFSIFNSSPVQQLLDKANEGSLVGVYYLPDISR